MAIIKEIKKLHFARVFKPFVLRHMDGSVIVVRDRGSLEYPADESKIVVMHDGFEDGKLAEVLPLHAIAKVLSELPGQLPLGNRQAADKKPGEYTVDDVRQYYYAQLCDRAADGSARPYRIRLLDGSTIDVTRPYSFAFVPGKDMLSVSSRRYPWVAVEEIERIEWLEPELESASESTGTSR